MDCTKSIETGDSITTKEENPVDTENSVIVAEQDVKSSTTNITEHMDCTNSIETGDSTTTNEGKPVDTENSVIVAEQDVNSSTTNIIEHMETSTTENVEPNTNITKHMDCTNSIETGDSTTTNEGKPVDTENSVVVAEQDVKSSTTNITEQMETDTEGSEDVGVVSNENKSDDSTMFDNMQFIISDAPIPVIVKAVNSGKNIDEEFFPTFVPKDMLKEVHIDDCDTIVLSDYEEENEELQTEIAEEVIINDASKTPAPISISETDEETDNSDTYDMDYEHSTYEVEPPTIIAEVDLCGIDTSSEDEYIVNLGPGPKSKTKCVRKKIRLERVNEALSKDSTECEEQPSSSIQNILSPNNDLNEEENHLDSEIVLAVNSIATDSKTNNMKEEKNQGTVKFNMAPNTETTDLSDDMKQVYAEVDLILNSMSPQSETNSLNEEGNLVDTSTDTALNSTSSNNEKNSLDEQGNKVDADIAPNSPSPNNLNDEKNQAKSEIDTEIVKSITKCEV